MSRLGHAGWEGGGVGRGMRGNPWVGMDHKRRVEGAAGLFTA